LDTLLKITNSIGLKNNIIQMHSVDPIVMIMTEFRMIDVIPINQKLPSVLKITPHL